MTAYIPFRDARGKQARCTFLYSHGNAVDLGQMLPVYRWGCAGGSGRAGAGLDGITCVSALGCGLVSGVSKGSGLVLFASPWAWGRCC